MSVFMACSANIPVIAAPANKPASPGLLLELLVAQHSNYMQKLKEHGAILFRGFNCNNPDDFSNIIEACRLGKRCSTKDYDFPRTVLPNDVYTSSDLPPDIALPLHHEKPRTKNPPNYIYFCCVIPPEQGGGTIFANAADIWRDMPFAIQKKLLKHGVMYQSFFHGATLQYHALRKILANSARSWRDYFGSDKEKITEKLSHTGIETIWSKKDRDLITRQYLPGVLQHPLTRQNVWFNCAAYLNYYSNFLFGELNALPLHQYLAGRYLIFRDILPLVCHYGNGQAFSSLEIEEINRIIQRHSHVFKWQKGDFMIVDNITWMHGKQPHQGNRLLYSCMTAY
ncbi:TauD/TfdA family dioxygenase [Legionella sp. 27cVA30]|uniref:TauD/TfdA family dioxygenase n=1 Tax=Legionella sp. 27cVA30 TaxID=2905657 RepID=UPI00209C7AAD|nr:TauD/TfdA family dioxygenase [Legionella sp. 27cVA30]MCP0913150.1 TauD/TfdA family dioxygenase [Legionella sp. 27cVA30]